MKILSRSDRTGPRDWGKLGALALSDDKVSVIPHEGVESVVHPGGYLISVPLLLVRGHRFDRDERGDLFEFSGLYGLDGLRGRGAACSVRERCKIDPVEQLPLGGEHTSSGHDLQVLHVCLKSRLSRGFLSGGEARLGSLIVGV